MGRLEKIAIIGVLICFLQIITTINNIGNYPLKTSRGEYGKNS